jgi:predicted enzyme related to lactoylglutathione lyase
MTVTETFFSVEVEDMPRATAFYVGAFGALVAYSTPRWSSLRIAGVRLGLAFSPGHAHGRVGLHFAVRDIPATCAEVERAGGRVVEPKIEVAPGVVQAWVVDTEGNSFALSQG